MINKIKKNNNIISIGKTIIFKINNKVLFHCFRYFSITKV